MDIAQAAQKGDTIFEVHGLKVFLEERAKGMLMDTKIDYHELKGFILTGAQANFRSTCSC